MKQGICSGYVIGLSSYIDHSCSNKYIGAFLFGIGLVTICAFELPLFTGRVGEDNAVFSVLCILLDNLIGMGIAIIFYKLIPESLSLAIACGSLMQIGVSIYSKHPWVTLLCVAAFLLSGFKHCIAMVFDGEMTKQWAVYFLIVILGNIIGARFVAFCGVRKGEK